MKNEDLNFEASSNIDNEDDDETEKEAIELLKTQHEQIQQLKSQNENKDKMIKMMKNQIVTLSDKVKYYESAYEDCERMKAQYDSLIQEKEHLRSQLYEKEQLTTELQNEFNEITAKFQILNEKISSQEDSSSKVAQLVELVRQYSKELTEATQKNKMYEQEISKLNSELSGLMKKEQKIEIEKNALEKDIKEEIDSVNKDMSLLCQWIDNYLGVYFDPKVEIPEIPLFYTKTFNFDTLREKILKSRSRIYEQQAKNENSIQLLHNEQIDLISKIDKLNKTIASLKSINLQLQDELNKVNITHEELNQKINKAQIDLCNNASSFNKFLAKLNKKIIKLKQNDPKYISIKEELNSYDNTNIYDTQNIFENNLICLLDYIIEIENKNEILNEQSKSSITKEELNTVKGFYQSRIDSLENEVKKNFDMMNVYKDDKAKLINQLRELEIEKNKILQDNLILLKQNQNPLM